MVEAFSKVAEKEEEPVRARGAARKQMLKDIAIGVPAMGIAAGATHFGAKELAKRYVKGKKSRELIRGALGVTLPATAAGLGYVRGRISEKQRARMREAEEKGRTV